MSPGYFALGRKRIGAGLRGPQCLSLRVRSPHAFAFVAMFGGILLEFFGPEPAHTRAPGDRLSLNRMPPTSTAASGGYAQNPDAAAIKIAAWRR